MDQAFEEKVEKLVEYCTDVYNLSVISLELARLYSRQRMIERNILAMSNMKNEMKRIKNCFYLIFRIIRRTARVTETAEFLIDQLQIPIFFLHQMNISHDNINANIKNIENYVELTDPLFQHSLDSSLFLHVFNNYTTCEMISRNSIRYLQKAEYVIDMIKCFSEILIQEKDKNMITDSLKLLSSLI
jgi:hypothetical protein